MRGVIDLHCHLLPGVDDGPQTVEDALALARVLAAAGIRTVVATPHVDETWGVQAADVPPAVAELAGAVAAAGIELEVLAGAEVAASRLAELDAGERDWVRLGAGPYLLLECPHTAAAGNFEAYVRRLREDDEYLLLAHPERCPLFLSRPERLERLVAAGALCSITAGSLRGDFGRPPRGLALDMLHRGWVHDVASDAHGASRRGPDLAGALAGVERDLPGLAEHVPWLTEAAPAAILAGAPLPPRPALPRRRLRDRLRLPRLAEPG